MAEDVLDLLRTGSAKARVPPLTRRLLLTAADQQKPLPNRRVNGRSTTEIRHSVPMTRPAAVRQLSPVETFNAI